MRRFFFLICLIAAVLMPQGSVWGAADPAVTIVSPAADSTVTSSAILVSVKLTQPRTIRVTVTAEKKAAAGTKASSTAIMEPEVYTSSNNLSFYTKKIENVSPGAYKVKVETLKNGQVSHSSENNVTIKEKSPEDAKLFQTPQSGATQFLQGLLKSIFGN